jgi:hypothetical protein
MLNNKVKKIGGYPSPFVSQEEKAKKEYGLEYFKKMYSEWSGKTTNNQDERRRRYEKNRSYSDGVQDVSKYKDLLDVEGDTSYLNLDWSPVSIIPKFVDVIVGGIVNQEHDIICKATDPISLRQRKKDEYRYYSNMINNDFYKRISQSLGKDVTPKGFTPESNDELDIYMNLDYKQSLEISVEQGLKYIMDRNDFDETRKRVIRDLVVLGIGALKTSIDTQEGVKIRYVDPINLVTSHSSKPDFTGIQHAGEVYNVTISELKRMAGDQFSEEEYKKIAESYTGKNNNPSKVTQNSFYDENLGSYSYDYDDFSINILDAEFLSVDKIKYEKKENSFGGFSVNKKRGNYKAPKQSKNERKQMELNVKVVYAGKYIVGTDYVFDYGLLKNMTRPLENLVNTKLSYVIYQPNVYKMASKSLTERMVPFADQIQLAHLKIQQLLAKARPKGAAFELGALENVPKGDGTNFTPLDLQEVYDQTGNIYFRRQADDGSMSHAMPIVELENGIGKDMMSLIQIYQYNLQMIRDVTGINEARDASTPDKKSLVGVQKLALLASNNATRNINDGFLNITKRVCEDSVLKLQDFFKYSKNKSIYNFALGNDLENNIEMMEELPLRSFGMFIEVAPDEEEKAILEQNIQISLSQQQLRIEDAIAVRRIKNAKLANQMLILKRKKMQEEQQKIAEQNAQMNAQVQQQSAQSASQMKQQEMQIEAKLEQTKIQSQLQADAEKIKLEYELKRQFEQEQHNMRLKEIELEMGIKGENDVKKQQIKVEKKI